ncbi:hypothetical protein BS47DRAFT_444207 [Hydnum rufescens UP504]|uniref:Uncharacterized protein n=1 Tax=Hydnum rufescens UP504 TaxID=1448309 RepID=A0A9P6E0A0_9AGAM|nr:hypothetical protein BS47DRAFT_444207 [Hydnum rufescens UP504]
MVLDYEALREANIARNRALIASLGLEDYRIPDAAPKAPKKHQRAQNKRKAPPTSSADHNRAPDDDSARVSLPKKPRIHAQDGDNSEPQTPLRRSSRNTSRISYAPGGQPLRNPSPSQTPSDGPKERKKSPRKSRVVIVDETKKRYVPKMGKRDYDPKTYGAIPDVPVGTWFATRADCSLAAIHA